MLHFDPLPAKPRGASVDASSSSVSKRSPDEAQQNPGSFTKFPGFKPLGIGPILGQPPKTYVTVKRRVRPIAYTLNESMFNGIEMDVIHMPLQVPLVTTGNIFLAGPIGTRRAGRRCAPSRFESADPRA